MHTKRLLVPTYLSNNKVGKSHHIAYTEWGGRNNPHVVICVHGLTRNCRDYDFLANALETDCRVFCVDVVGRGQSDWLDHAEDYDNYQLYLSDVKELLTYIRKQYRGDIKLDWIGISMGGLIGMLMAINPEIPIPIRRLIMSDIGPLIPATALQRMSDYVGKDPHFNSFDEFDAYLRKISVSFGPLTEDQWHHLSKHSARKYDDGTYGFLYDPKIAVSFKKDRLKKDIDLWGYWDQLQVPTLVLRGTESDVLSPDTAAEMQKRGPKAEIVELTGIGHAPIFLDSKQIAIAKEFLLR
ncbi:MAG: alpha/beta hydrolase [Nitrosomonas sp.]|nr:alpha/beta hydrolase [Nitrosomonas sp.]